MYAECRMKCAILLVAYGSSTARGQGMLRSFDARVRMKFPGLPVRWAYTSPLLRERLARGRQKSDSVPKALRRLCFEKFDTIAVQPLQTIPGREHAAVLSVADEIAGTEGVTLRVGEPLLASRGDIIRAARALLRHLPPERRPDEDVVFMGHGARHDACSRYGELAAVLRGADPRVHVGAMSGADSLEDILPRLSFGRVWLLPLLSTVGRHALEDMAGKGQDSWRARIVAAGHECVPVLKGTVEYPDIAEIWLDHLVRAAGLGEDSKNVIRESERYA